MSTSRQSRIYGGARRVAIGDIPRIRALRDWLRWRQDARAATDAGLPTGVPLGHVLLLHA